MLFFDFLLQMLLKFDAEILVLAVDKSRKTCKKYNNWNCRCGFRAASELNNSVFLYRRGKFSAELLLIFIVSSMLMIGI